MCEDITDKFRGAEGGVPQCWGGEEGFFPLSPSRKLLFSLLEEKWDKLALKEESNKAENNSKSKIF